MKFKEFNDLPIVKPATALANNYHDSHMKATHRSSAESERLYNILGHYQKNLEKEIAEEEGFNAIEANGEATVNL